MRLVYAPRDLRDIDEILGYIQQRSPNGARIVSFAIEHTVQICADHPLSGTPTDEPHVYRWPLSGYRYTIFYRFDPARDVVEIVRVVHAARVRGLGQVPSDD